MSKFDKNAPSIKLENSPLNSTKFSLLASGHLYELLACYGLNQDFQQWLSQNYFKNHI